MSLRAASFRDLAARLSKAAESFAKIADAVDAVAVTAPAVVPSRPVEGVARPVEDLVVARENFGIYPGLDAARRHAVQAVLNAECAGASGTSAIASYEAVADR